MGQKWWLKPVISATLEQRKGVWQFKASLGKK
jgi:hypothetical protein